MSSSWLPHGGSSEGFIQAHSQAQSKTVPAVVAYRGHLWCLWADLDGNAWYAVTDKDGVFDQRLTFGQAGVPVVDNLNGHLHAVVVLDTGDVAHFLLDDEEGTVASWVCLGSLGPDAATHSSPCLVAFHNRLFLVFLKDGGELYYTVWTGPASSHPSSAPELRGTWSVPAKVVASNHTFEGIPALVVIRGKLHLLCASDSETREILCYSYDYAGSQWSQCDDISEGRAARGISATSYGETAYMGFIETVDGRQSDTVIIGSYINGQWQPHEQVGGEQSAADPPQIAILNGRIHCIFNDNTATKDLRWYSRPILDYSLASWMTTIQDRTLLSRITIPGTHDSCARSNIPFVRTQYLSITQQLALGIRFLDLRLRRHDDGDLYCYHGGIPLGLPRGLSFVSVMNEVWTFLRGPQGDRLATETILVSVNNDDTSPEQITSPEVFYGAVQEAITAQGNYPDGTLRWCVESMTPLLSHVRGRAVLLRRYAGDPGVDPKARIGLDLSAWVNDSPYFTIVTPWSQLVHIQDKWKFSNRIALKDLIISKSSFVRSLMARAAAAGGGPSLILPPPPEAPPTPPDEDQDDSGNNTGDEKKGGGVNDWYINFCSAVGDPLEHGEVAEAKWIAVGAHSNRFGFGGHWIDGMNKVTRDFVFQQQQQRQRALEEGGGDDGTDTTERIRLGIVNLDYPELPLENDLVTRLIETNFLA